MNASTLERVLAVAARRCSRSPESIRGDDDIYESLEIDSVDLLEIVTDLERIFEVQVPDLALIDVRTFVDLAALIDGSR